ncbi:hypothetical protein ABID56_000533 [Alkalibacillus flavidus]|uniref:Uncharacterized protein n=1 Tax=Alkalibacillus flavidus TaxID=546021 RepID=A0ABV2KS97_9BACI
MGGLIELIASNIFVIIAAIVGLLSVFQDGDKEKNTRNRPVPATPSGPTKEKVEEAQESVQQTAQEKMDELSNQTSSWYEAMEDSRQRLEDVETESRTGVHSSAIDNMDTIKRGSIRDDDRSSIHRVSVHENITRKRIVESVIMAEVLGKPKAKAKRTL